MERLALSPRPTSPVGNGGLSTTINPGNSTFSYNAGLSTTATGLFFDFSNPAFLTNMAMFFGTGGGICLVTGNSICFADHNAFQTALGPPTTVAEAFESGRRHRERGRLA
jgi:hypothetical protein